MKEIGEPLARLEGGALLEDADGQLALAGHRARVRLEGAIEYAEEGGFAAAIAADEAYPLSGVDSQARPLEKGLFAESLGYSVYGDKIHVARLYPAGGKRGNRWRKGLYMGSIRRYCIVYMIRTRRTAHEL